MTVAAQVCLGGGLGGEVDGGSGAPVPAALRAMLDNEAERVDLNVAAGQLVA